MFPAKPKINKQNCDMFASTRKSRQFSIFWRFRNKHFVRSFKMKEKVANISHKLFIRNKCSFYVQPCFLRQQARVEVSARNDHILV